jgi:quercetin dioxygenase-like cupin family protein
METENLRTCPSFLKDGRSLNTLLPESDLDTLIENIKHSQTWAKGELNAIILLKNPDKQIILTALHEGTEINSFQSNDSVSFQIIEGKMKFHTRKESINLYQGQLLTLHENIKYTLTTMEETVFLLTVSNGTLQPPKT